jgi:hypothetical protein
MAAAVEMNDDGPAPIKDAVTDQNNSPEGATAPEEDAAREATRAPGDDTATTELKWKLRAVQSKLAGGIWLVLMPPVFFCDRSFGHIGWGISLFCCFAGFLIHRMLPVFLSRRGIPLQDVVRIQLAFQGVPFLFGLMALINPSLLKVDLPIPTNIMSAIIAAASLAGTIIVFTTWPALKNLAKDPAMSSLAKPLLR